MALPGNRTKIVATIGPASESPEMLERASSAVAGPSSQSADANYRIEFLRVGEWPQISLSKEAARFSILRDSTRKV